MGKAVDERWNSDWGQCDSKLLEVMPHTRRWKGEKKWSRAEQRRINRLGVGHCNFSHGYLMEGIERGPPGCPACGEVVLTVKHIMTECPVIDRERRHYFGKVRSSMQELLGEGRPNQRLFGFLREIQVYNAI